MSVFVGASEVKEAFVGSTEVKEIWAGSNRVWTNVPDINFAPDQWTSGAAGTVWTLERDGGGSTPYPQFLTDRVRLYGYRTGTFPEWTYADNYMTTGAIQLEPSTNYNIVLQLDVMNNSRFFIKVDSESLGDGDLGWLRLNGSDGLGPHTEPFTSPANGIVYVKLEPSEFTTESTAYSDVSSVYLEKA